MAGRAALELIGISRSAIIDSACRIVDEAGLEALTLKRVAALLRIGPPSIYRYFRSLNELHDALTAHALEMLIEVHEDVGCNGGRREAIEAFALAERVFAQAHPALYAAALRRPRGTDSELVRLRKAYTALAETMLSDYALSPAMRRELANCLSAALQGFINNEIAGWGASQLEFDRNFERLQDIMDEAAVTAEMRESAETRRKIG